MQQAMLAADAYTTEAGAVSTSAQDTRAHRLGSALLELSEEHRIVLCLHFFEHLSLAQIGVLLDDSEENVREVFVAAVSLLSAQDGRRRDAA